MSWLEIIIIVFIAGSILYLSFRSGTANPESTGSLLRRINRLEKQVKDNDAKSAERDAGIEADLQAISRDVSRLDSATQGLGRDVSLVRESIAGLESDTGHTRRQVDRLYDFIVEKGMRS